MKEDSSTTHIRRSNGTGSWIHNAKPIIAIVLLTATLIGSAGIYVGQLSYTINRLSDDVKEMESRLRAMERERVSETEFADVKAYANSSFRLVSELRAQLISQGVIRSGD